MTPLDTAPSVQSRPRLVDGFGRAVTYLRVSVTDRCDLRCVYCMAEHKGVMGLFSALSHRLATGDLDELTLTTNGTRLETFAGELAAAGVQRVNVSLDTLDPEVFRRLTRGGDLAQVLRGLEAAKGAGLAVKINAVALRDDNAAELPDLIAWAHGQGFDATLIEAMPMGDIDVDRSDQFLSLRQVRDHLESFWTLTDLDLTTGGPARYVRVAETGGRLGFITPLSHNFCELCNRVRLTCTGTLHTCLGREDASDLRAVLRAGASDTELREAIRAAVDAKPEGHDFRIDRNAPPAVQRHMSTTGG
ncbi:MAG: GTP 3',8-cyclase MoaA [Phenylobacterium sp.]|nr:GTP 3',8-cyclase MoaA [Phenylobacterium sp.]